MGIVIREANIAQNRDDLVDILNSNRNSKKHENRFNWLYLDNPAGLAMAWLGIEEETQEIAGACSAFPRVMCVKGEKVLCWNCGDLSVNAKFRRNGVGVKLRMQVRDFVDSRNGHFLYAHPNDRSKGVHVQVGHLVLGEMIRFSKILKLRKIFPSFCRQSFFLHGLESCHRFLMDLRGRLNSDRLSFTSEVRTILPDSFFLMT